MRKMILFGVSLVLLSSCYIDSARQSKNIKLTIASDYLLPKDTILFESFKKNKEVNIEIQHLNRKELESWVDKHPYDSGIDLLMYKSIYDTYKLKKERLTQKIYGAREYFSDTILSDLNSGIIGLGYDPFVYSYNIDSLGEISSVGEVRAGQFKNNLSKVEQIVFLSGFRSQYDNPETMQFALGMDTNSFYTDSLLPKWRTIELEMFSEQDTKRTNAFVDFGGNSMFDVRTVTSFSQSSNFEMTKEFIRYLRNPKTNARINEAWNTIKIDFDLVNTDHKFVPISKKLNDFFQYYTTIERIQKKIKNGKS